jgi:hypothetical protein
MEIPKKIHLHCSFDSVTAMDSGIYIRYWTRNISAIYFLLRFSHRLYYQLANEEILNDTNERD